MRNICASGIVLRRIELGETDLIITVFTRECGKLSAAAKGSRRPGSKLGGASEPLTYSKLMLASGRDLYVLTQAEIKESFPHIRNEITSVAYGVYLLELVNAFVDLRQPNADVFDSLLSALYILEGGIDPEIAARYFEIQLLSILGYEPHIDQCLKCGRKPTREVISFSPAMGGIVCSACGRPPADSVQARAAVATYISALKIAQPPRLKDMQFPKGARGDMARILRRHIRYQLEHDLKSAEFIDTIAHFTKD